MKKELSDVRTHRALDGNVWHCARDVYKALDITWSGATMKNTPQWCQRMFPVDTPKGIRLAIFISQEEKDFLQKHRQK